MRPVVGWLAGGILAVGIATGCGRRTADGRKTHDDHEHADGPNAEAHKHGHGHKPGQDEKGVKLGQEEMAGVVFKKGRGLQLSPTMIKSLGLETVEAADRELTAVVQLSAQVFATKPQVLVTASMSKDDAERWEKQSFTGARITRIDRTGTSATHLVDVVLSVDRSPPPQLGDFITVILTSEPKTALAIPRSGVLDAATGTYVYVVNGEFYLRTPVKLGARSADQIEVIDGLYTGDMVVVSPVDQLWLAELRLTKGGGHSH